MRRVYGNLGQRAQAQMFDTEVQESRQSQRNRRTIRRASRRRLRRVCKQQMLKGHGL